MARATSQIESFLCYYGAWVDLAIIEGVMGLYDGGREGVSSTAQIAKQLDAPVVLVIDARLWVKAQQLLLKVSVIMTEVNFGGVIFNHLGSANHERMVREGMAKIGVQLLVLFIAMIVCTLQSVI